VSSIFTLAPLSPEHFPFSSINPLSAIQLLNYLAAKITAPAKSYALNRTKHYPTPPDDEPLSKRAKVEEVKDEQAGGHNRWGEDFTHPAGTPTHFISQVNSLTRANIRLGHMNDENHSTSDLRPFLVTGFDLWLCLATKSTITRSIQSALAITVRCYL